MNLKTKVCIISIASLAAVFSSLGAANADSTYACALDPAPPCVRVIHGQTTGDGDCDASNGAGSSHHSVTAWTGANPAGNQSVTVVNECGSYSVLRADVTYILPQHVFYHWATFAWYDGGSWCFAAAWTGGRGNLVPLVQDLSPVFCQVDGPPMLP